MQTRCQKGIGTKMHKCLYGCWTRNNDVYSSLYSTSITNHLYSSTNSTSITANIDKCLVVVNAFLINEQ